MRTAAQRIGDAPAVLLRNYAKRKRPQEADKKLGEAISTDDGGLSHDVTTTESNARTPIRKLLPKICPDWVCVLIAFSNRLGSPLRLPSGTRPIFRRCSRRRPPALSRTGPATMLSLLIDG